MRRFVHVCKSGASASNSLKSVLCGPSTLSFGPLTLGSDGVDLSKARVPLSPTTSSATHFSSAYDKTHVSTTPSSVPHVVQSPLTGVFLSSPVSILSSLKQHIVPSSYLHSTPSTPVPPHFHPHHTVSHRPACPDTQLLSRVLDAAAGETLSRKGPDVVSLARLALALLALAVAATALDEHPLTTRGSIARARLGLLVRGDAADEMVRKVDSTPLASKYPEAISAASAAVAGVGLTLPPAPAPARSAATTDGQRRRQEQYVREVKRALSVATRAAYATLLATEGQEIVVQSQLHEHRGISALLASEDAAAAAPAPARLRLFPLFTFPLPAASGSGDVADADKGELEDEDEDSDMIGVLVNDAHILPPPPPSYLFTSPASSITSVTLIGDDSVCDKERNHADIHRRWSQAGVIASLSVARHIFLCSRARARATLNRLEAGEQSLLERRAEDRERLREGVKGALGSLRGAWTGTRGAMGSVIDMLVGSIKDSPETDRVPQKQRVPPTPAIAASVPSISSVASHGRDNGLIGGGFTHSGLVESGLNRSGPTSRIRLAPNRASISPGNSTSSVRHDDSTRRH